MTGSLCLWPNNKLFVVVLPLHLDHRKLGSVRFRRTSPARRRRSCRFRDCRIDFLGVSRTSRRDSVKQDLGCRIRVGDMLTRSLLGLALEGFRQIRCAGEGEAWIPIAADHYALGELAQRFGELNRFSAFFDHQKIFGEYPADAICLRIATACGVIAIIKTISASLLLASAIVELNCVLSSGKDAFSTTS